MIKVTRLDGEPFLLNAEMIRFVESRPDTFVTLMGGERVVVRESMDEVLRRCLEYQRSKQLLPEPQRPAPFDGRRAAPRPSSAAFETSHRTGE
jgi:flagellar protein FlbD